MFTLIPASAEQCDGDTCVAVSADDENHLLISVKKGRPGATSTNSPKPRPTKTYESTWIPWLPKPVTTPTKLVIKRPVIKRQPKPRIKRISGNSLEDKVKRALPSGLLIAQPMSGALLREPVNLFTTIPPRFSAVIVVIGVPITIEMKAQYIWHFPDGTIKTTNIPGAPYPLGDIQYSFEETGPQNVELEVIWRGTWRTGSISAPIDGSIRQIFEREIYISPADSRFTR